MKWKNRLTNYNFWISIVSAVLLILQAFNFEFDIAYISEIATAVLGLLVVIGIISDPTKTYMPTQENKETTEETESAIKETEEETKEAEQSNIDDVKVENDNVNNESNFKTVIEFISKEINKTVNEVLKNSEDKSEIKSSEESEQATNEANFCNIVN